MIDTMTSKKQKGLTLSPLSFDEAVAEESEGKEAGKG